MLWRSVIILLAAAGPVACANDAGDFAPGPICDQLIVHGENDEVMQVGGQLQLGFVYEPCDLNDVALRKTQWSSSNTEVATVSSTGLVTARAVGTAVITASVPGGSAGLQIQVVGP
ncbi:MAG TPA: Ig-like domain-containing protein [Gemmatimonadales bacterium]|nr:Ig-like domain-containing protein [Gemmatimonadales bacterium]